MSRATKLVTTMLVMVTTWGTAGSALAEVTDYQRAEAKALASLTEDMSEKDLAVFKDILDEEYAALSELRTPDMTNKERATAMHDIISDAALTIEQTLGEAFYEEFVSVGIFSVHEIALQEYDAGAFVQRISAQDGSDEDDDDDVGDDIDSVLNAFAVICAAMAATPLPGDGAICALGLALTMFTVDAAERIMDSLDEEDALNGTVDPDDL